MNYSYIHDSLKAKKPNPVKKKSKIEIVCETLPGAPRCPPLPTPQRGPAGGDDRYGFGGAGKQGQNILRNAGRNVSKSVGGGTGF